MEPETVRAAPPAGDMVTAVYNDEPVPLAFRTALAVSTVSQLMAMLMTP